MNDILMKLIKLLLILILIVAIIVIGYVIYLFATYERIEDETQIEMTGEAQSTTLKWEETHSVMTYNIGFGAYSQDFTFFMDEGEEVKGRSFTEVEENVNSAMGIIEGYDPDFIALQEVDVSSDRSYEMDQSQMIQDKFTNYQSAEAINYDSAYLFYPVTDPIGSSLSEIMTLSKVTMNESVRRSVPIDAGINKFFDLDRCYMVSEIDVDNGKKLYLYNVHLSAYGAGANIKEQQLEMLFGDMQEKAGNGHYVIATGDFNNDLSSSYVKYNGEEAPEEEGWAQPINEDLIPRDFVLLNTYDADGEFPSTRKADIPYNVESPEDSTRVTVDGYIVSDNIKVVSHKVINTDYMYSDHMPVYLEFGFY